MRSVVLLSLLLFVVPARSEDHKLILTVKNIPEKEIYLASFYGEKTTIIDTVMPVAEGKIIFEMKPAYHQGMYRIFLDKQVFFDIIYNRENIEIITDFKNVHEALEVVESKENQIYYDFLRAGNDYRRKFDLLAPLNDYYPRTDTFFLDARLKYILVQADFLKYVDSITANYPTAWATRIIRQKKPLFYDPSLDEWGRREYAVENYFNNITFDDVELIRSNVYTNIAIEYMSLYSNPNLPQEELEKEFIKAVDKTMFEAAENNIIYEFIVDYLVGGFERFHFDKVLDYIAENYSPELCENEERKTDLQTRLEKYAELAVGKPAPDINLPNIAGQQVKLSKVQSEYTLVLFWASWCSHCAATLPEIRDIYNEVSRTKLEILAVSLDENKQEWESAVNELRFNWVNISDLKGWNNDAAIDYNVYATPTMLLLDNKKNILAKPITINELNIALQEQKIIR